MERNSEDDEDRQAQTDSRVWELCSNPSRKRLMAMNCYQRDSNDKPLLSESIVCYADILGFKDRLSAAYADGTEGELLETLDRVMTESHDLLGKLAKSFFVDQPAAFAFKWFSDNLVLGYPLGDRSRGSILSAIDHISTVQSTMAIHGFLLRGGLAVGSHYMDGNLVFGAEFIRATELDRKGRPPCIALTQRAEALVRELVDKENESGYWQRTGWEGPPEWYFFLENSEGNLFLNYLDAAFSAFPDGAVFMDLLEKHRETIIAGLQNCDAPEKYTWAAQYHNFICTEFAEDKIYRACPSEELLGAMYQARMEVGNLRIPGIAETLGIERIQ